MLEWQKAPNLWLFAFLIAPVVAASQIRLQVCICPMLLLKLAKGENIFHIPIKQRGRLPPPTSAANPLFVQGSIGLQHTTKALLLSSCLWCVKSDIAAIRSSCYLQPDKLVQWSCVLCSILAESNRLFISLCHLVCRSRSLTHSQNDDWNSWHLLRCAPYSVNQRQRARPLCMQGVAVGAWSNSIERAVWSLVNDHGVTVVVASGEHSSSLL